MSSYTAIIKCKVCGKVLAEIKTNHKPRPDWFVPQDIVTEEFALSPLYCQDCLDGGSSNND